MKTRMIRLAYVYIIVLFFICIFPLSVKADDWGTLEIESVTYGLKTDASGTNWSYDADTGVLTLHGDISSAITAVPNGQFPYSSMTLIYSTDVTVAGNLVLSNSIINGSGKDTSNPTLTINGNIQVDGDLSISDARLSTQNIQAGELSISNSNVTANNLLGLKSLSIDQSVITVNIGISSKGSPITISDSKITVSGNNGYISCSQTIISGLIDIKIHNGMLVAESEGLIIDITEGSIIDVNNDISSLAIAAGDPGGLQLADQVKVRLPYEGYVGMSQGEKPVQTILNHDGQTAAHVILAVPVPFYIQPQNPSLAPGETLALSLVDKEDKLSAVAVSWQILSNKTSSSTYIDANGVLHIGADEQAASLSIQAMSADDDTNTAEVTVSIATKTPPKASVHSVQSTAAVAPPTAALLNPGLWLTTLLLALFAVALVAGREN
ncbi:MAG: hypothetical protein LBR25_03430 [Erysipelotrichaceae bacterium]|nr:hypothetical protein [Erysipelotrichaceae bacterium]